MKSKNIQAVIDIGASSVRVCLGYFDKCEWVIVAAAQDDSAQFDNGLVTDLYALTKSLNQAIDKAQKQANVLVQSAIVGISCPKTQTAVFSEQLKILNSKVKEKDKEELINQIVKRANLPYSELLHLLPLQYLLDKYEVFEPKDMAGDFLELMAIAFLIDEKIFNNIKKSLENAGVDLQAMVYNGLAVSELVLTEVEKDRGVCLIDLGKCSCDLTVWQNNKFVYGKILSVGGEFVSSSLAQFFKAQRSYVESLKCQFGSVQLDRFGRKMFLQRSGALGQEINRNDFINQLIDLYQNIFFAIKQELQKVGFKQIPSLVLTGGASQIAGLPQLVQEIFGCEVRLFIPYPVRGMPEEFQGKASMNAVLGLLSLEHQPFLDFAHFPAKKQGIIKKFLDLLR